METYPKIETLFGRDPSTFKVIPGSLRKPEFWLPNSWLLTEKIDGTNAQVSVSAAGERLIGGRTERAQFSVDQVEYLTEIAERARQHFTEECEGCEATVFGELYGPKIQKGGGLYRKDLGFRVFDVKVGEWWLNWKDVESVATSLGLKTVPVLGLMDSWKQAAAHVNELSTVSLEENPMDESAVPRQEGVVARTDPLLFDRRGGRVMWKLKGKDLP
jgi:hypothetical protein